MIDAAIVRLLLEASLRVLVVAIAVGSILVLTRVTKGSVRHTAWTAVVITMLLMPALVFVVPQFELPRSTGAITFFPTAEDLPYIGQVDFDKRLGAAPPPATTDVTANYPDQPPAIGRVFVAETPAAPVKSGFPLWLVALGVIYAAGLLMLLFRWIRAARFLSRLRRASQPVDAGSSQTVEVFESAMAATPITVGAVRPWIVLPMSWRSWAPEKLAAVLAHERSHIRRHDPLIGLVAYVNRCIYWFNPLSWWLERQVAAAAEHAADEEGAKAIGQEKAYAEVLLDMAATVREHGGRVAWQGVGVDGNGLLGRRIDRVLSRSFLEEVSPMKTRLILFISMLAIVAAVACKRPVEVPPLTTNPKATAQFAAQNATGGRYRTAHAMSATDLDALEAKVRQNPESLDDRWVLLEFYRERGQSIAGAKRTIDGRREQALWLIEHHPEAKQTASARIDTTAALADPSGFAAGRKLWLALSRQRGLSADELRNAASFLKPEDPQAAYDIALETYQRTPGDRAVSLVLASIYASTLTGTNRRYEGPTRQIPVVADDSLAVRMRATLEKSTDARLLAQTGRAIMVVAGFGMLRNEPVRQTLDILGRSYIARAVALDAAPLEVADAAAQVRAVDVQRKVYPLRLQDPDPSARVTKVMAIPEAERFPLLASLADEAYSSGEALDYNQHDTAKAQTAWTAAKAFAENLVAIAPKYKNDPDWSSSVLRAHVVLGLVALRNGDVSLAVKEMKAAPDVPVPAAVPFGGQIHKLATTLLQCGERETVAEFYDRSAALYASQPLMAENFTNAAAAIRAGQMTVFMQDQLGYLEREKQWKADMAAKGRK